MHCHIRMLSLRTCATIYACYFWENALPIRTLLLGTCVAYTHVTSGNMRCLYARYFWEHALPIRTLLLGTCVAYTHVTFGNMRHHIRMLKLRITFLVIFLKWLYIFFYIFCTLLVQEIIGTKIFVH